MITQKTTNQLGALLLILLMTHCEQRALQHELDVSAGDEDMTEKCSHYRERIYKQEDMPSGEPVDTRVDKPDVLLMHYTASSRESAINTFTNPSSKVSAHYLVDKRGKLIGFVNDANRAFHAGHSAWNFHGVVAQYCTDINTRSIGIETENSGSEPYTDALMQRLKELPDIL